MSIGGEKISRNYRYQALATSEFEQDKKDEDNGLHTCINKRQRNSQSDLFQAHQNNDTIIIEKPIVTGESLTSISLKYRIPVPELKRVNKIEKDVEFYALSVLKIPVKTNSSLLDILNDEIEASKRIMPTKSKEENAPKSSPGKVLTEIKSDSELEEIVFNVSPNIYIHRKSSDKIFSCSGADWDLSWWKILVAAIVILIGAPLLYYMILF